MGTISSMSLFNSSLREANFSFNLRLHIRKGKRYIGSPGILIWSAFFDERDFDFQLRNEAAVVLLFALGRSSSFLLVLTYLRFVSLLIQWVD